MIHFLYFIVLSIGKIVFFSECQILIMELKIRILNFEMVQRIEKGSTQPLYNKNYYLQLLFKTSQVSLLDPGSIKRFTKLDSLENLYNKVLEFLTFSAMEFTI